LSVSRASAAFPSSPIEFAARFKELVARHELVPTSLAINADQEIRRGRVMSDDEMGLTTSRRSVPRPKLGFPVARYQYGAGRMSSAVSCPWPRNST